MENLFQWGILLEAAAYYVLVLAGTVIFNVIKGRWIRRHSQKVLLVLMILSVLTGTVGGMLLCYEKGAAEPTFFVIPVIPGLFVLTWVIEALRGKIAFRLDVLELPAEEYVLETVTSESMPERVYQLAHWRGKTILFTGAIPKEPTAILAYGYEKENQFICTGYEEIALKKNKHTFKEITEKIHTAFILFSFIGLPIFLLFMERSAEIAARDRMEKVFGGMLGIIIFGCARKQLSHPSDGLSKFLKIFFNVLYCMSLLMIIISGF